MVKTGLDVVVRHVRRVAAGLNCEQCTDPELLRQFALGRDEGAFAALVRRHGPMVMRVCRHVLHQDQDAEDAFQVTFLVLARKPSAVRKGGSLASFLHGVAYRTAMTARRRAATRRRHEARAETMSKPDAAEQFEWREVQAILEEEVQALPEMYRAPFVLCQMEGRSRAEAARELGIKEGTVSSRLQRGQQRLRARLAARGLALSAVLGIAAIADAGASIPRGLLNVTVQAGMAHAAGRMRDGAISTSVEVLLRAVTQTLRATRGKVVAALLAAIVVVAGAGTVPYRLRGQHEAEAAAQEKPPSDPSNKSPPAGAAQPDSVAPGKVAKDTFTVSGQVLDPEGKAFAGAEVSVRWGYGRTEPAEPRITTTSGSDGRFRLRFARSEVGEAPMPPDVDPYHFIPLRVVAAAKGYGPGGASVHIQRGAKGDGLILRLAKDDVPIKGRILDVQLRPVTDATVRVLLAEPGPLLDPWPGMPKGVTTDKEGRFVLTGIGRDRKVRLSIGGPTIERKTIEVSTGKPSDATIEVIARPTRVLEGTVCADDTGKPLAGVVVRGGEWYGRYTRIYTRTDAQGRYRLVGLPKGGSYEVTAWPNRGQTFLPKTAKVGDSQGLKPITVDFRLQRGVALRVRLVDKGTGKPVRGVVHYDPLANNPSRPTLLSNGRELLPLWQFQPFCYPDKDYYCRLVVPKGPGVIMGKGHDLPYLTRPLDPADEKVYPFLKKTPAEDGGIFHFWELFQSYRVFDAKAGDKPLDVDIELDPGCKVEGKLIGPDEKPVVGAVAFGLTHSPQNTANWSYRNDTAYRAMLESRTLEKDHFVTAGLSPDAARTVTFLHAGRKLIANLVVRANQKDPLVVRMEPWGAVTGRVVDGNGKAIAGLPVELLYPSQDGPGLLTPGTGGVAPGLLAPGRPFRTDNEGRFRVEGLIPGQKHRLTFTGGEVKDLSTKAGEVRDLPDIQATQMPAGKNENGGSRE